MTSSTLEPAIDTRRHDRAGSSGEHYCTYFDRRFLLQGLALHTSLAQHSVGATLWVLCMDEETRDALDKLALPGLRPLSLAAFESRELAAVKPSRTFGEYCWTLTPALIEYILDNNPGASRVTYLDADCYFFSDPGRILAELDASGKQVLITPHDYAPEHDLSEQAGEYCVQFVTFSQAEASRAILQRWRSQCVEWCFDRFEDGRFGDQKYLDPWPEEYPGVVHVLGDPALALGPWSAARHLARVEDVCMYHFHGLRLRPAGKVRLFEGYPIPQEVVDGVYLPYVEVLGRMQEMLEAAGVVTRDLAGSVSIGARLSDYRLRTRGLLKTSELPQYSSALPPSDSEIRLGSGAAATLAAHAVGLLSNVAISVLIARALGPAGKGALSVIQQTVAIALTFANLGISTSNLYFVSKREVSPGVAVGNSLALAGVTTALASLPILLLLYGPLAVLPGIPLRLALVALASFTVSLLLAWFGAVVVGLRGLKPQAMTAIVSTTVSLALVIGLSLTGVLSVSGVMIAGVFGAVAGLGCMLYWGRGRIGKLKVDIATLRRTAKHSARVHLSGLADFLHLRQDILLLGWLAGSTSVGYYSVGVSFAELAWYVPNAVGQAIQAQAGRVSHESALDFAARSLRLSLLITVAVGAVLAGTIPWLLPMLFGETFAASVPVFYLLLPGAAFNGLTAVMLYYQLARGTVYWRVSVAVTAGNVLMNLVLVPFMGAPGAAIASTVSYSMYFFWILALVVRDSGIGIRQLLVPTGADVRLLVRVGLAYLRPERHQSR